MSAITPMHVLLVLVAAFFMGVRAFRETRPKGAAEDEDSAQMQRVAKAVTIGLVVLMIALVIGLNLRMVHVVKVIQ